MDGDPGSIETEVNIRLSAAHLLQALEEERREANGVDALVTIQDQDRARFHRRLDRFKCRIERISMTSRTRNIFDDNESENRRSQKIWA